MAEIFVVVREDYNRANGSHCIGCQQAFFNLNQANDFCFDLALGEWEWQFKNEHADKYKEWTYVPGYGGVDLDCGHIILENAEWDAFTTFFVQRTELED